MPAQRLSALPMSAAQRLSAPDVSPAQRFSALPMSAAQRLSVLLATQMAARFPTQLTTQLTTQRFPDSQRDCSRFTTQSTTQEAAQSSAQIAAHFYRKNNNNKIFFAGGPNACARTHTHARIDTLPRAPSRLRRSAATCCYSFPLGPSRTFSDPIGSRLTPDCSVAESNIKVQKSCKKFGGKEIFS